MEMNSMMFIMSAGKEFNEWLSKIDECMSFEDAKKKANAAIGFRDCMIVFHNNIHNNNKFRNELEQVLDTWIVEIYQHMAEAAERTHQSHAVVMDMLKQRDYHRALINA